MLTIKDFKKGDTVFSVTMNIVGRLKEPDIIEQTVSSVGRVYVTTGNGSWAQKYADHNSEYLLERATYGESHLLFKTRKDAENYIEKYNLAIWLGTLSIAHAEKYSLEQLRKVKEILK